MPVYDGFTRFDVSLAYAGTRRVQTKGYSGPVVVCNVRYTPIAGHRNRKSVQFMSENKDIQVWLGARSARRGLVPYRISVATMMGATVIEATEFGTEPATTPAL